jgi:hypothetical protein
MSLFVEYYDADPQDNVLARTGEMDYQYQAEQWAIDALEDEAVVAVKAFYGPRPAKEIKIHDRPLFAEWRINMTPSGRQLQRVS